jgi:hypothetical protein
MISIGILEGEPWHLRRDSGDDVDALLEWFTDLVLPWPPVAVTVAMVPMPNPWIKARFATAQSPLSSIQFFF